MKSPMIYKPKPARASESEAPPPRPPNMGKAPPSRPANLTPQSGAAQSGTAGKVPPKSTEKSGIQNFDKNKADAEARRAASQVQKKAMGGKLKMVEKDGKKVPAFAADGVGKMAKGGKMAKSKESMPMEKKEARMAKGGKARGMGAATKGGNFSKNG